MSFKSSSRIISQRVRSQNDRYHQRRLSEIRNSRGKNIPALSHIINLKGAQQEEQRKELIEKQNGILLDKMMHIMDKKAEPQTAYFSSRVKKQHPTPDFDYSRERERISSVKSSYSQDLHKNKWIAGRLAKINKTTKQQVKQGVETGDITPNPARQSFEQSMKLFDGLKALKDPREKKEIEDKFNKPQEISQRVVLYLKSFGAQGQSLLLEISAAYGKLIILIFDMMKSSKVRRLVLDSHRTAEILNEYNYSYEQIAEQLIVTNNSVGFAKKPNPQIGFLTKRDDQTYKQGNSFRKSPAQRQNEFIQRNFYQQIQKRNLKPEHPANKPPLPPSQMSHRLNISHDIKPSTHIVKPATAVSSIRKRFQFEIPQKQRKPIKITMLKKGPAQTIEQQKTENSIFHTQNKTDDFKQNKSTPMQIQHIQSNKSKQTASKQHKQPLHKSQPEQQEQKQPDIVQSKEENQQPNQYDEYDNNFEAEEPHKPQSRAQARNRRGQKSSKESSDLHGEEDSDLKAYQQENSDEEYNENGEEHHEQSQENQEGQAGESGEQQYQEGGQNYQDTYENYEQQFQNLEQNKKLKQNHTEQKAQEDEYGDDFVQENLKLSTHNDKSKPLIQARNPHDLYEQDFEISQSKA